MERAREGRGPAAVLHHHEPFGHVRAEYRARAFKQEAYVAFVRSGRETDNHAAATRRAKRFFKILFKRMIIRRYYTPLPFAQLRLDAELGAHYQLDCERIHP
jgi:hypothetical protein